MLKDVKVPEISENVTSGNIVEVHVAVGDEVAVDDVLVEMETEKAVVEIPSPYAGKIGEVLVEEGDEKNVGDVIVRIEVPETGVAEKSAAEDDQPDKAPADAEQQPSAPKDEAQVKDTGTPREETEEDRSETSRAAQVDGAEDAETKAVTTSPEPAKEKVSAEEVTPGKGPALPVPAAPSVRRLARELGVDIHAVQGSGSDGRISPTDVHDFVKQRLAGKPASEKKTEEGTPSTAQQPSLPDFSRWGGIRKEKITNVRRLTAENTGASWRIIPHVTQFDEADITDLQPFLDRHGKKAVQRGGKLTITAVLMKVCAEALRRFPAFNASIDMTNRQMIYKDYVHIGMAVDTPRGLLVPVIRDVSEKGIIELAAAATETAQRARDKKIKPEEFEGATFTISNQGGIGGLGFTPVVVWPQAAILGISRARRMPVERDGSFVPRTMLPLSLSYDHRIADGADAARFLGWICRSVEQGLTMFL